jgi:hypothetical protein
LALSFTNIKGKISGSQKGELYTIGGVETSLLHFTNLADIPDHWEQLVKHSENYLLSKEYLSALELHPYKGMCFHYMLAVRNNAPVAILYYQESDVHITNVDKNVDTEKVGNTSSFFTKAKGVIASSLDSIKVRLLIQGNLFQSGPHGAYFDPSLSIQEQATIVNASWNRVVDSNLSGTKIKAILVKDISAELEAEVQKQDSDFAPFAVQPNMVSDIHENWTDIHSVLADFSSKYRVRAKAAMKKQETLTRKEFDLEMIQKYNETIMQLFKNVEAGADFHMVSIDPNYFTDLKTILRDRFIVQGYFDGAKLIGFYSYLKGDRKNYASFVGLNYEYNRNYALYQNMLYCLLHDSIKDGAKRIDLARTAMEIKSTMGAKPQQYHLLAKHVNSFTNSIVKRFLKNLRQKEWTQRRPFKNASQA